MKKNDPIIDVQNIKSAQIADHDEYIFLQFNCPHCHGINVFNKQASMVEYTVCAYTSCRKVIKLDVKYFKKSA